MSGFLQKVLGKERRVFTVAKVNAPLLSFGASGSIGDALTFFPWKGLNVVRTWVKPANPNTGAQSTQRGYMTTTVATIHAAEAVAVSPLGALDTAAYALDAATENTPRTWFNQIVAQCVVALKAVKQIAVFRGATVTPGVDSIVIALKWTKTGANDITAGDYKYGTTKTSMIYTQAAVIAASTATGTIVGLTTGVKYFMQFVPSAHADYALVKSGIYFGTAG